MDTALIFDYLTDLEFHNERPWYHAHKAQHKAAYEEFLDFLGRLMMNLSKTDPNVLRFEPKQLTFRVVRDMRYARNGLPYRPAFRAHIGPEGKAFLPCGYFIQLSPGGRSYLAGGIYTAWIKDVTDHVRRAIAKNSEEWANIVTAPLFTKHFDVLGETLKNVPRDFDKDHPMGKWLKHKSWYVEELLPDDLVLNPQALLDYVTEGCEAMQDFNRFLNRAIQGVQLPERHR